jgi:hypothetical protein
MKTFKEFLLAEVDSRSQYDKAKALYDHPSTHPNIKAAAKSAMDRLGPSQSSAPSIKRAFPGPGADWSREEKHKYHNDAAEMHNNGYNIIMNNSAKRGVEQKYKESLDYHWGEMQHHRSEAEKYA